MYFLNYNNGFCGKYAYISYKKKPINNIYKCTDSFNFFDKTKTIINIIKLKLYSLATLIYYNSPFKKVLAYFTTAINSVDLKKAIVAVAVWDRIV